MVRAKLLSTFVVSGLLIALVLGSAASAADPSADAMKIRHVMAAEWDKPASPLLVDPVVIGSLFAVAGWTQGDGGGRALLRRSGDGWIVVLCSGDELKSAESIVAAGVSQADAREMAARLQQAEATLAADILAKFSSFHGLVRIDGNHAGGHGHPPSQKHK